MRAAVLSGSRRRTAGGITYGPRVTPGLLGAVSNPALPGTITRLAAGTYTNYSVPAGALVLPAIGAEGLVNLQGQTNFGAGSTLYGVRMDPNGAGWAALIDSINVGIMQCDLVGNPGIEHIRARRTGAQIVGDKFTGSPPNHNIKVDGRSPHSGGGTVSDNSFPVGCAPTEDYIQFEGQRISTCEHNSFAGLAGEDCLDIKPGEQVTVRGHDFAGSAMNGEAVLAQNGTAPTIIISNRFGSGCFASFGANLVNAQGSCTLCVFLAGSTLRLRRSGVSPIAGVEVAQNTLSGATVVLGTSTSDDFPRLANFHHNSFTNLIISIGNAASTTVTNNNTYAGSTTGSFPSGNN